MQPSTPKKPKRGETQSALQTPLIAPVIKPEELKLDSIIGEGQYGIVYRGKCKLRGNLPVAVKVLHNREWDDAVLIAFVKEVEIMSKLNHPNVVTLLGACTEDRQSLCIVTELLEVDLRAVLHNPDIQLSNLQKYNFAIDIAMGMAWLHNAKPHPIIHRDLKPSNLLLDSNWRVKVCDFGLSTILPKNDFLRDQNHAVGSAIWMAPEVLMGKLLSDKLDVYSFALILWEIWTRKEPYGEYKTVEQLRSATCKQGSRPSLKKGIPGPLVPILESCWAQTATSRPAFSQTLDMLKEALVATELGPNPRAVKLWSECWPGLTEVAFKDLEEKLMKVMGLNIDDYSVQLECLKILITHEKKKGSDTTPCVNIHKFGLALSWFGPMDAHPWEAGNTTFLDRAKAIMSKPWFFGDIERTEAEDFLLNSNKKKKGTFLVRLNLGGSEEPSISPFIISKLNKEQRVEHIRVYPDPVGFHIRTKVKGSSGKSQMGIESSQGNVPSLIKRLKSRDVLSDGLCCQKYKKLVEGIEGASMYYGESIDSKSESG